MDTRGDSASSDSARDGPATDERLVIAVAAVAAVPATATTPAIAAVAAVPAIAAAGPTAAVFATGGDPDSTEYLAVRPGDENILAAAPSFSPTEIP